jgi:hypothetical protein
VGLLARHALARQAADERTWRRWLSMTLNAGTVLATAPDPAAALVIVGALAYPLPTTGSDAQARMS